MRLEINIQSKHVLIILLFIIAASATGLVVAYNTGTPSIMGHTWGEMTCDKCITTANIGDNNVTGAKIQDGSISGADIQDGSISGSDISSIDGSKVTGTVPNADTVDGLHAADIRVSCGWSGWAIGSPVCGACCPCSLVTVVDFYCDSTKGRITSSQKTSVVVGCGACG